MSADFDTTLRAILSESGLDDPEGSLHGWRCAHPDRFPGYCRCVDDLVTDVKEAHERALAEQRAEWEAGGPYFTSVVHECCEVAQAAKPRTLTADDPEPADGSVVLDKVDDAWQRRGELWHMAGDLDGPLEWAELLSTYGPLRLIHDGGQ